MPKGHFSAPLLTGRTVGNPRIRLTLDKIIIPLRLRKSGLRAKREPPSVASIASGGLSRIVFVFVFVFF